MRKKKDRRISSVIDFSSVLIFSALFALIIQIAVLLFDFIEDKVDASVISIVMLGVIIGLALIATVFDLIRRKITIDRPVEKILDATDRISNGDFSAKIEISSRYGRYSKYDLICENVNKMTEELRKNEMISSDFISGVSHEIKTPLAVIKNYAKALGNENLTDDERNAYSKTIIDATERLDSLVSNVLKLTKLENSEIICEKDDVDLSAVIAEIIFSYEEKIERKNIRLSCDLDEIVAFTDRGIVELIFSNLLSNAVKFTPDGGSINISLKRQGEKAEITVKDSGIGISAQDGARIFDKFYQVDKSRRQEGNGLGLALVKKAVEVIGGEINVRSEQGKGSTFSVCLGKVVKG